MSKTLTITISDTAYDHLRNDAENCEAGDYQPCAFSEVIVHAAWYAANAPEEDEPTPEEIEEALRIEAGEAKFERENGR